MTLRRSMVSEFPTTSSSTRGLYFSTLLRNQHFSATIQREQIDKLTMVAHKGRLLQYRSLTFLLRCSLMTMSWWQEIEGEGATRLVTASSLCDESWLESLVWSSLKRKLKSVILRSRRSIKIADRIFGTVEKDFFRTTLYVPPFYTVGLSGQQCRLTTEVQ